MCYVIWNGFNLVWIYRRYSFASCMQLWRCNSKQNGSDVWHFHQKNAHNFLRRFCLWVCNEANLLIYHRKAHRFNKQWFGFAIQMAINQRPSIRLCISEYQHELFKEIIASSKFESDFHSNKLNSRKIFGNCMFLGLLSHLCATEILCGLHFQYLPLDCTQFRY